jgi:AhpD family alkylhydroperoxidase
LIHRKAGLRLASYLYDPITGQKPMNNWPQQTTELSTLLRGLRGTAPDVMKAFAGIARAATVSKALDVKTKELIALGIAVAVRCDDCIAFHAKAAVEHGATRDEVSETLGMAIYMGAGPSVMYASHALEAFTQFEAAAKPSVKPEAAREEEEIRLE